MSTVPARPAAGPEQRLQALEDGIRNSLEDFFQNGTRLKEIRDDELYKAAGFATWEAYCKERWGWSRDYTYKLIRASEYRAVIPGVDKKSTDHARSWTESSVRELTRLEDKRDAAKVAAKVVKAVEQSERAAARDPDVKPVKLTAGTVRKFVDEELGIDRAAAAREARQFDRAAAEELERRRAVGRDRRAELGYRLRDTAADLHRLVEDLKTVPPDALREGWELLCNEELATARTLLTALGELGELLPAPKGWGKKK
jgi:hypothetical protein